MGDHDSGHSSFWAKNGYLISTAYSIAGAYIGFLLLGNWLDEKYQTGTRYTLSGLALASIYTFYEIWKLSRAESDPPPSSDTDDRDHTDRSDS